jgi:hypothetical protein
MSKRLDELRAELAKHFGKTTRWKVLCKKHHAETEEEKVKLAEQVLAEWSTGTVAEWRSHRLDLEGVKPMDLDEFLGRRQAPKGNQEA